MASSTGPLYTTLADVQTYLPASFASIGEYSDALLTQDIRDAGRTIDSRLNRQYAVPFAATTDTPDTPEDIQTFAKMLAAQYAMIRANRSEAPSLDENGESSVMRFVFKQLDDLNTNKTHLGDVSTPPQKAYLAGVGLG